MKLRIQGNSVRLRVSKSEAARFATSGRLEETFHYGTEPSSSLTYAIVQDAIESSLRCSSSAGFIAILVPVDEAQSWFSTDQVGIYGEEDLGVRGKLSILIEKDFACLDRNAYENADTFPNPLTVHSCVVAPDKANDSERQANGR